jgi:hypothetical protein
MRVPGAGGCARRAQDLYWFEHNIVESALISFVGFSDLDNNTFKGLTT